MKEEQTVTVIRQYVTNRAKLNDRRGIYFLSISLQGDSEQTAICELFNIKRMKE